MHQEMLTAGPTAHYAGPIKILLGPQIELPQFRSTFSPRNHTPSEAFGRTAQVLRTSQQDSLFLDIPQSGARTASTGISTGWTSFEEDDGESSFATRTGTTSVSTQR